MNIANKADEFSTTRIREGWMHLAASCKPTHGLTINFNRYRIGLDRARELVRRLFFRIDRKLLGARFNKKPDQRTDGVFFFEHLDANVHCHGLVRAPPARADDFADLFPGDRGDLWSAVCPGGTYWLSDVASPSKAAEYITKEQRARSEVGSVLFLRDFAPTR